VLNIWTQDEDWYQIESDYKIKHDTNIEANTVWALDTTIEMLDTVQEIGQYWANLRAFQLVSTYSWGKAMKFHTNDFPQYFDFAVTNAVTFYCRDNGVDYRVYYQRTQDSPIQETELWTVASIGGVGTPVAFPEAAENELIQSDIGSVDDCFPSDCMICTAEDKLYTSVCR
jgi:hypothetical protein